MIKYFGAKPEEKDWKGIVRTGDESHFIAFKPVYFRDSCMHCHGPVENAPKDLIELYGSERGFNRKVGDLAGVIAVGIPVDIALSQVRGKALSVFMSSFFIACILFVLISSYFNRLVAHDLRKILHIFRTGLSDGEARQIFRGDKREDDMGLGAVPEGLGWADELKYFQEVQGKDEIEEITISASAMAQHLKESHSQLERNAENLERTVAERTTELRESEQRLREQVLARNRELQTLNTLAEMTTRAGCLSDVFPMALEQTLRLISAGGAGLYLFDERSQTLELQCHKKAPSLTGQIPFDATSCSMISEANDGDILSSLQEAACGHISFFKGRENGNGLNVPLCCRGRVLGVISFTGLNFEEITPELHELLFSVGRQIGIAIESLQTIRKLIQSKEILQSVFDGITDMVILMGEDLRVKMVNKAYLKRYNLPMEDVLGRSCFEMHADDACPHPNCGAMKVLQTGKPRAEEVTSSAGEIFLMHFYPVLNEEGRVESIVRYARDITDQRQIEQQIQKTEKLASLGQLAAGIAHEINNPLGVILCYTDLLKRQVSDQPQSLSDVSTIEKHALNCKRVVSDLLKFARSGPTVKTQTSLNGTIEEVVGMVSHQFSHNNIDIQLELDPELPLISMDADKIKQVFLNLLMNSQQAIGDRGIIRISSSYLSDSNQARVVFWDDGKGIPPEVQQKVFDPFFSTKEAGEGTGLGLSVSYGIIKEHHGEIHISSEPGNWTEFTILLPANESL
jgi:PAS domain S-box-containing protein